MTRLWLVMPGLVPGIHVLLHWNKKDVDGRAQASGSDAVLQTAMPGHDERVRFAWNQYALLIAAIPAEQAFRILLKFRRNVRLTMLLHPHSI